MKYLIKALEAVGAILFLLYELVWNVCEWLLKAVEFTPFLLRVAYHLRQLHPYVILAIFAIPLGFCEIVTLASYKEFALGNVFNFVFLFAVAKILGFMPMVWIFDQTREQLLSIGWFAITHGKIVYWKAIIHSFITSSEIWKNVVVISQVVRYNVSIFKNWSREKWESLKKRLIGA